MKYLAVITEDLGFETCYVSFVNRIAQDGALVGTPTVTSLSTAFTVGTPTLNSVSTVVNGITHAANSLLTFVVTAGDNTAGVIGELNVAYVTPLSDGTDVFHVKRSSPPDALASASVTITTEAILPTATVGQSVTMGGSGTWVTTHPYDYDLTYLRYDESDPAMDVGAVINAILVAAAGTVSNPNRVLTGLTTQTQTYSEDGWGVTIRLPPGKLWCGTTIDLTQESVGGHISIIGSGGSFINTTIVFDRTIGVGINAKTGREVKLQDLRLLEQTGEATKNLCLVNMGGQSPRITNVWASNANVGFMISGAGGLLENCLSEECTFANLFIPSMFFSTAWSIPAGVTNVFNWRVTGYHSFNGPVILKTYKQLTMTLNSGADPAIGQLMSTSDGTPATNVPIIDVQDNTATTPGEWIVLVERYAGLNFANTNVCTTDAGGNLTVDANDGTQLKSVYFHNALLNATLGGPDEGPALIVESAINVTVDGIIARSIYGLEATNNTQLRILNFAEQNGGDGLVCVENTGEINGYNSTYRPRQTGTRMKELSVAGHDATLEAHWKLDDTSGGAVDTISSFDLTTESGGAPTYAAASSGGRLGTCVTFATQALHITSVTRAILQNATAATTCVWFKQTPTGTLQYVLSIAEGATNTLHRSAIYLGSTGNIVWTGRGTDGSTAQSVDTDSTGWDDGLWHFVVARVDFVNDVVELWVDNQLEPSTATGSWFTGGATSNTTSIAQGIGGTATATNRFIGSIDDVRIYSGWLSEEKMTELWNMG